MTIDKIENVWSAGVHAPPDEHKVFIQPEPVHQTPPSTPPHSHSEETAMAEVDTIQGNPHYRIAGEVERATDAALTATEYSQDALQAAEDADRNAQVIAEETQKSAEEAHLAIEQTHTYIAATNLAAERALQATRSARQASHQAFEFTRKGMADLEAMGHAMDASESRIQDRDSSHLFERTQTLKQQTAALRQQLMSL
ncbi:MAG: hypothetical protein HN602_05460 [Gammaproteobacteria bacterium]|nr:hypothetical protein [Gammaproteobacteria bacterium]